MGSSLVSVVNKYTQKVSQSYSFFFSERIGTGGGGDFLLQPSNFFAPASRKVLHKYKLKPENLENLLFLTLNKHKTIDYQSLAYELIKTWKYEVENKVKNWKTSSS